MKWKLMPEIPTDEMRDEAISACAALGSWDDAELIYSAMFAVAPHSMSIDEARDLHNWKGMDPATAWSLIERDSLGWNQTGAMMQAWHEANK